MTGEIDTRKPDPTAFERICDRLEVRLTDAAYVGDDPEADVAGAADVGMRAVQVRYDGGPPAHPDADAVVERRSLAAELPSVLSSL